MNLHKNREEKERKDVKNIKVLTGIMSFSNIKIIFDAENKGDGLKVMNIILYLKGKN